ncbi:hypothetical protein I3843_09G119600 [Carya illinoinensis]|uniref:Transmembrane protein n=1 Tax=Carya illinoinensis TaxID=32201 RepID=A0A8T1PP89_CARIL|nr:uncharacterized protein LOC122277501 [Carya illinoinensis]KAG2689019.1 hypothetical protein I3760_09G120300 [Carya illinoinensis]KAG6642160.1 hypothetical protein CIPAW_09G124100 [Carya illinoinensis]KAG6695934.1 hypothetical protein I3842_09G122000 [Carya illinoinensis]KAG7963475.1 hypothetical protein I3843_09G119600 [Carya illinoinensis]
MGLNQNLKYLICTVLFLFLLLGTSGFPSPVSSREIQPKVLPHEVPADQYQEFYVKNTDTFAMNGEQDLRKKRRSSKKNIWRKKIKKEKTSRPFAVMLPKGFVPPSGSSPCSNKYPHSARATFHCDP